MLAITHKKHLLIELNTNQSAASMNMWLLDGLSTFIKSSEPM
jgi:hypothetical protein